MVERAGAGRARAEREGAGRARRPVDARLIAGGVVAAALLGCAVLAPVLAPRDPAAQDLMNTLLPPPWLAGGDPAFPLGTDSLGRDVLSRLIYGTRVATEVAVVASAGACAIGATLGVLAGFLGGWVDQAVSRVIDVWMAFPPVLLAIVLAAVLGAGLDSVIAAIIVIDWTRFARVLRAEAMAQRSMDYVAAARMLGLRGGAIMVREILPNLLPLLLTLISVEMGIAIIVEAVLSFVGLSVTGDTASWGGMIAEGRTVIHEGWWIMAGPMLCLFVAVLGFNMLGDGVRLAFDPLRRR
jgi:peptide/nickel transport system permease protein